MQKEWLHVFSPVGISRIMRSIVMVALSKYFLSVFCAEATRLENTMIEQVSFVLKADERGLMMRD